MNAHTQQTSAMIVRVARHDRVVELLARVLLASTRFHLPGTDGETIAEVVTTEYPAAAAAGWVPGPAALAASHPELADA